MLAYQHVNECRFEGPQSKNFPPFGNFQPDATIAPSIFPDSFPSTYRQNSSLYAPVIDSTVDSLQCQGTARHAEDLELPRNDLATSKIFPLAESVVQRCMSGYNAFNQNPPSVIRKSSEPRAVADISQQPWPDANGLCSNFQHHPSGCGGNRSGCNKNAERVKSSGACDQLKWSKSDPSDGDCYGNALNKRHSTRKLPMTSIAPWKNINGHVFSFDAKTPKDAKQKKRKKRDKTFSLTKSVESKSRSTADCKTRDPKCGGSSLKSSEEEEEEEEEEDDLASSVMTWNPLKKTSSTFLSHLNPQGNKMAHASKTVSQMNINYNSGDSDPDCSRAKQCSEVSQSNNNSTRNKSIMDMAREMLKKSTQSLSKSKDVYAVVDMGLDRGGGGGGGDEEEDDELSVRRRNSERWLRLSQISEQATDPIHKASKISRSSVVTVNSETSGREGHENKELIAVPDGAVLSTSKKSRIYMSSNVHLRRLYQPAGVVNYLTQRYKHRQPKLNEGAQGYDQTVKNIVRNLHDSWLEQSQCDVAIVTDEGEIMSHQAVLSSFSSSLAQLFRASKPGTDPDACTDLPHPILMINMSEFPRDIIADALHFLYTTDIKIDISNVSNFVLVARRLDLHVLSSMCDDFLINSVNLDTMLLHYLIANNCELEPIAMELASKIAKNFEIVWTKKYLVKLSRSLFIAILDHPNLAISEINKFHAVAKWLDYNKSERMKYINDLMKFVDFDKIEISSLLSTVKNLDWMFTNETMRMKMLNAYKTSMGSSGNINTNQDGQEHGLSTEMRTKRFEKQQDKKAISAKTDSAFQASSNSPTLINSDSRQQGNFPWREDVIGDCMESRGSPKNYNDIPIRSPCGHSLTSEDKYMEIQGQPKEMRGVKTSHERAIESMASSPTKICYDQQEQPWSNNSIVDDYKHSRMEKIRSQGTSPLEIHRNSPKSHKSSYTFVHMGTAMTPNFVSQRGIDREASNSIDGDEFGYGLKSQGIVSLFLPNYRPPPFKQYQLTNNVSSIKYVEI